MLGRSSLARGSLDAVKIVLYIRRPCRRWLIQQRTSGQNRVLSLLQRHCHTWVVLDISANVIEIGR